MPLCTCSQALGMLRHDCVCFWFIRKHLSEKITILSVQCLGHIGQRTASHTILHDTRSPCRTVNGAYKVRSPPCRGEVGLAIAQKVLSRPELAALELFSFRAYGSRKRLVIRLDKASCRNAQSRTSTDSR